TPPAVGLGCSRASGPRLAAWSSDGPLCSLGSQWSPTFSNECLSESYAVRWARSPSPYCSTALSWVLAHVRWALADDRLMVPGISFSVGMPEFVPRRRARLSQCFDQALGVGDGDGQRRPAQRANGPAEPDAHALAGGRGEREAPVGQRHARRAKHLDELVRTGDLGLFDVVERRGQRPHAEASAQAAVAHVDTGGLRGDAQGVGEGGHAGLEGEVEMGHRQSASAAAQYGWAVVSDGTVRISAPSSVTTMVCSNWAVRRPSTVTAVQPSSQMRVRHVPAVIMGSMVKTIPGSRGVTRRGVK